MLFGGSIFPSSIQLLCSRQSSPLFSVAEDGLGEKNEKLREKVQKCVSLSPSSAPTGFCVEFERKLEKRLPRTHSSALPFHPLTYFHSHIFYSAVFSRLPAHTNKNVCKCAHAGDTDKLADRVRITGIKEVGCAEF